MYLIIHSRFIYITNKYIKEVSKYIFGHFNETSI